MSIIPKVVPCHNEGNKKMDIALPGLEPGNRPTVHLLEGRLGDKLVS